MNDDERKRLLERAAHLAGRVATGHPDPCPVGKLARDVVRAVRRELAGGDGPAQVASDAYRDGWDTLFGKKQVVGQA